MPSLSGGNRVPSQNLQLGRRTADGVSIENEPLIIAFGRRKIISGGLGDNIHRERLTIWLPSRVHDCQMNRPAPPT